MIEMRVLAAGDDAIVLKVADGVFDSAVQRRLVTEFLSDPRHHLVVAVDDGLVVGMASGVHYVHPDKPAELWINEVGVAPTHRRRGIATALVKSMLEVGRRLSCKEAWVLTDRANPAAMGLYAASGGVPRRVDQVMFEFWLDDREAQT